MKKEKEESRKVFVTFVMKNDPKILAQIENFEEKRKKQKEYCKKYYSLHKEEICAHSLAYYYSHKEERSAYYKEYNSKNKEERHEKYMREREKRLEYQRMYNMTHLGMVREESK